MFCKVAGIEVKNMAFGEAMDDTIDHLADGALGLAASETDVPTVFGEMVRQKLVPEPVFSFYVNRCDTNSFSQLRALSKIPVFWLKSS